MDSVKLIATFLFNAFILWGLVDAVFAISKKLKQRIEELFYSFCNSGINSFGMLREL